MTTSAECGARFERNPVGRSRMYCLDCSPRDKLGRGRGTWRRHRLAYNAKRRRVVASQRDTELCESVARGHVRIQALTAAEAAYRRR